MAENLYKTWANAEKKLSDIFDALKVEKRQLLDQQGWRPVPPQNIDNPTIRAISNLTNSIVHSNHEQEVRTAALERLRDILVAEHFRLIGVNTTTGAPELIPAEFWLNAKIEPELDQAASQTITYERLRMLTKSQLTTDQTTRKPERLRREAIEQCDKHNRVDLSGGTKSNRTGANNIGIRTEVYQDYLRTECGIESFEEGNYSDKSFERSETRYKKEKAKQLQSGIVPKEFRD